jgi:HPt (histidine-containing phosphotransfer) domain-containing protein
VIQPACDPRALITLHSLGGSKLVRDLIDLFLNYAPERMATARASIDVGDTMTAERALHSLKSSAGQLGAVALREGCGRAEALAAHDDAALADALADIESLWPATRDWLIEHRG